MCDADVPTVIVGGNGIGLILHAVCDGYTFDADVPIEDALRAYDKLIAAQHARHDLRRDIRAQLRVPDDVCRCFANVRLQKRDTGKRLNKLISDAPSIVSEWCAKQCKQDWKYLFALQSMGRPSMMRVQRVPQATTGHKVRDGQVKHAKPRHVMDSYAPLGAWVVPSSAACCSSAATSAASTAASAAFALAIASAASSSSAAAIFATRSSCPRCSSPSSRWWPTRVLASSASASASFISPPRGPTRRGHRSD